jgi:hypothetical protein
MAKARQSADPKGLPLFVPLCRRPPQALSRDEGACVGDQSHSGGLSGSRWLLIAASTSLAKSASMTAVESSGNSAMHSEMRRSGGTGGWITATGRCPLSITISAPADTRAKSFLRPLVAASASEMWIVLLVFIPAVYMTTFSFMYGPLAEGHRMRLRVTEGQEVGAGHTVARWIGAPMLEAPCSLAACQRTCGRFEPLSPVTGALRLRQVQLCASRCRAFQAAAASGMPVRGKRHHTR